MKWVTRERPKIDRIACPWLILRFIDAEAEFLYLPADEVLTVAATAATPYDIPGADRARCRHRPPRPDPAIRDPAIRTLGLG